MVNDDTALIFLVALPFAASLLAALFPSNARNAEAWLAGGVALAGFIVAASFYPAMAGGGVIRHRTEWIPALGLEFSLRMDGFAWMFVLLITGIGLLVALYARYYMSPADPVPRFFSFLLAFMGAMLGVVLSGNLVQLVFFWELTGLFSFLLIGYWHHNANAREGARMALTVTVGGGLALLAGVLLLGHIAGSYDLDHVLAAGEAIRSHRLYLPALVLVALGALTKSAQFPFHFWLPQAMAAPTPVSAYLHSATLVKAGVFLLARLWPALAGTDAWVWIVGGAGLCTLLLGAYFAIFQHDLKGLLAYSTISHLGLVTLLLGLNSPLAAVAAIFHIMNHATFKASLFMAAGVIDHETGTRDMRRLSGLRRLMPITATLAMVASAAMAGVPLLNGFISKEMFFSEALAAQAPLESLRGVLPLAATLAGMFTVAYSLRFIHKVFFGPDPVGLPRVPHEPPRWMRFPIEILVLACVAVGVAPGLTVGPVLDAAAQAALGAATPSYSLTVWHGFNMPLAMSLLALAGGAVLYRLLRAQLARGADSPLPLPRLDGPRLFDAALVMVSWRWARALLRGAGARGLQAQLFLVVAVALTAGALPVLGHGLQPDAGLPIDAAFAAVWVVGGACALAAAYQAKLHRLAALILLGGAGLATTVTFVWLSAPDLALTQLLVEIVTTVLILLGLRWLPKRLPGRLTGTAALAARARRARDFVVAAAAGTGLAFLAYAVMTRPAPQSVSRYFVEHAYEEGGGTNVVNVILVDFRALDTLGEITVLGVAALAVYALLRRFRPAPDSIEVPQPQRLQAEHEAGTPGTVPGDTLRDYLMVPAAIMRLLFPAIVIVGFYLLVRGHDQPGGGFIAGLTVAAALILQYMAGGTRWAEARLRLRPLRWIGLGLLAAALTGSGAWVFGYPFLTSYFSYAELPLAGRVPLASAFPFDVGVFGLVVGATTLVLIALAHQSIRSHRAAPEPEPEHAEREP